jgi:NAD(P)-dependent dehydrogenase (short-subunit alcohol dehydrogenase family)
MAVARRFGREGFAVGLVSRSQDKLDGLVAELESEGVQAAGAAADIRDSDALAAAIRSLAERLGEVEVLEYSPLPAREFMKPILETTVEDVRGPLEFSVLGAVAATHPRRAHGDRREHRARWRQRAGGHRRRAVVAPRRARVVPDPHRHPGVTTTSTSAG